MEIKEKTNENAPAKVVNKTTETLIKELETMSDMHKSVKNGQLKKTPSYGRIEIYLP